MLIAKLQDAQMDSANTSDEAGKVGRAFRGDVESDGFSASTPGPWKKGQIIAICTGTIPSKRIKGTRWIVEYRVDGVSWGIWTKCPENVHLWTVGFAYSGINLKAQPSQAPAHESSPNAQLHPLIRI